MEIARLLNENLILCDLRSSTKIQAIKEIARQVVQEEIYPSFPALVNAILDREKQGPTALGKGVAFPHASIEGFKDLAIALGISKKGIDFRAEDKQAVHLVILLISSRESSKNYLKSIASFTKFVCHENGVKKLTQCQSPHEVIEILNSSSILVPA